MQVTSVSYAAGLPELPFVKEEELHKNKFCTKDRKLCFKIFNEQESRLNACHIYYYYFSNSFKMFEEYRTVSPPLPTLTASMSRWV